MSDNVGRGCVTVQSTFLDTHYRGEENRVHISGHLLQVAINQALLVKVIV